MLYNKTLLSVSLFFSIVSGRQADCAQTNHVDAQKLRNPTCCLLRSNRTAFLNLSFGTKRAPPGTAPVSAQASAETLKKNMRLLWNQRGVGMYLFVAAFFDAPHNNALVDCAFSYLLQNAQAIGDLFAAFYGKSAGDELTCLLYENTQAFRALTQAVGEKAAYTHERDEWYGSTTELAVFFNELFGHGVTQNIYYMLREIAYVMYDMIVERHAGRIESQADIHLTLIVMLRDLADFFARTVGAHPVYS